MGCSPWGHEESDTTERLHFHFHALEEEMATHSSVLAWRIPGTEEPGGLLSMGLHRVGQDWSDLAVVAAAAVVNPLCNLNSTPVGAGTMYNPLTLLVMNHGCNLIVSPLNISQARFKESGGWGLSTYT